MPTVRLLALVFLLALSSGAFAQNTPAKDRMVIVISLDGFPAFYLDDPKVPMPALRSLIRNGVSGRMVTVNPTVTWPNHTALVTGVEPAEHGVLVNGTLVSTAAWPPVKVDPMLAKSRMVRAQTVYDAAHAAGLTTAEIDWVAINDAATITYPFREWASPEGRIEQEMIASGVIGAADVTAFTKHNIVFRDQVWLKAALHLIRERKPNLMLLHFLSLDSVHHQFGPNNLAAMSTVGFLDGCVAEVVRAVREAGMQDRTTFLIVSDHGFKAYTKQIRPAVALAAAGLAGKVHVVSEGGTAIVYLDRSHPGIENIAAKALATVEGIDQVIRPEAFPALGLPTPERDPQMGHLLVSAKDGYAFSGATGGPVTAEVPQRGGSHGYLASDPDMDSILIASGYGVQRGGSLGKVSSLQVAPTLAGLLGVQLPAAKGKPLPLGK